MTDIEKPPFEVTETGWGEFDIQIRVTFVNESNEKPISFHHHLKLHSWTAGSLPPGSDPSTLPPPEGPINAWQYDEIVFSDPTQNFLNILLAHPPTPLPKVKRKAAPPHIAYPPSLVTTRNMPEFSAAMEKEEADRLDNAKREIVEQTDKLRKLLIEKEKELERLKKEAESQGEPKS
ncbi:NuA4 histone H4 acetyltransferase complex and the SWR1 complex subunit [Tulasnella sp. 418]|nr:NuA4 histone H4 acetyltransferase complex and the SWR1 complex subunit [Tulasnella sp. 418]